MAVENQRTKRLVLITDRRWDALNNGFENFRDADTCFSTCGDSFCRINQKQRLNLFSNALRVGGREIDFVDDGDDCKVRIHRQIRICKGLCFHTLCGIYNQQRTFACIKRARDFVRKVNVARRVDEVHLVLKAIQGGVVHPDRCHFDRDAALALNIHFVEELSLHVTFVDGLGDFKETVCKG